MVPKHLEEGSIKILFRDKIRVFYDTVGEAKNNGYHDFDPEDFPKSSCILYGYTGLRGDAKALHKSVLKGEEKRIQLVQAGDAKEQAKYVEQADLVIWACGYQTNKVYIRD